MKILTVRILAVGIFPAAVTCHRTVQTNQPNLSNGAVTEGIQVAGNRAIATEAIAAKIQTKAGDRINTAAIGFRR